MPTSWPIAQVRRLHLKVGSHLTLSAFNTWTGWAHAMTLNHDISHKHCPGIIINITTVVIIFVTIIIAINIISSINRPVLWGTSSAKTHMLLDWDCVGRGWRISATRRLSEGRSWSRRDAVVELYFQSTQRQTPADFDCSGEESGQEIPSAVSPSTDQTATLVKQKAMVLLLLGLREVMGLMPVFSNIDWMNIWF